MNLYRILFILTILCNSPAHAQYYLSAGYGYLLNHSENESPSLLKNGYDHNYFIDIGLSTRMQGGRQFQTGINYEDRMARRYRKRINSDGQSTKFQIGYLYEQTIPLYFRHFKTLNGKTGYGIGPVWSITKQTFYQQIGSFSPHKEVIYIHSPGITALARLSKSVNTNWYLVFDIEVRASYSLFLRGHGQDLSNYSHSYSQIKVGIGFGRRRSAIG